MITDGDDNAYNAGKNDDVAYPDDDGENEFDHNDKSPTLNSLNLSHFVFDDIE